MTGHLFFNYQDADNRYALRLETNGALKVLRWVDGIESVIAAVWNTGFSPYAMNRFRIVVRHGLATIYLQAPGSSEHLVIEDLNVGDVQGGQVGIYARSSTMLLDNLRVTAILD